MKIPFSPPDIGKDEIRLVTEVLNQAGSPPDRKQNYSKKK